MKYSIDQVEHATEFLQKALKPGTKVYTVLRRVSASGMTRHISLFIHGKDGITDITWQVSRFLGDTINRDTGGIVVGGCGMDMGFNLVYTLSWRLFPNGFKCSGESCRSNDHANGVNQRRKGLQHKGDGGYALDQRWL